MLGDLYRLLKTRVNVSGLLLRDRIRRSVGVHVGSWKLKVLGWTRSNLADSPRSVREAISYSDQYLS